MRAAGSTWDTIAAALDYASRGAACTDVARALEQRLKEQGDQVDHLRAIELEHLDMLRRRMMDVIEAGDTDEAIKATGQLVKIGERLARLQGMDAPVRVDQAATVRYEVVGIDPAELG
jgi:hypothetical protein